MDRKPFDYKLPAEKIAQRPVYPPDSARLLVVDPKSNRVEAAVFRDLPAHLEPDDLLVFNDTRVIPARLFGSLAEGEVEILLLEKKGQDRWSFLGKPMKKLQPGAHIAFGSGLSAEIVSGPDGSSEICFASSNHSSVDGALGELGTMPIPPYIRNGRADSQDASDYQPIFARESGSVAAPTASLHFTESLLQALPCKSCYLTLHVGRPSFQSVFQGTSFNPPGEERYDCRADVFDLIASHKEEGRRVIAVGTTVARALETLGSSRELKGATSIFIRPGHRFTLVDGLITNFHQPGTTHLLLVEALIGYTLLEQCYNFALDHDFRFLSYGDAMFILPARNR